MTTATATRVRLLPLGATGWQLWPVGVLRSAGFPAKLADRTADPGLLAAALAAPSGSSPDYLAEYEQAVERHVRAVREVSELPLLREAVAWQNPALLENCFDRLDGPRNGRVRRRQRSVVSYLKRYTLKNDSISFFGPIAWFDIGDGPLAARITVGPEVIARRSTHFESWAVDALAQALVELVEDKALLAVHRSLACTMTAEGVRRPNGAVDRVDDVERRVWAAADGRTSIGEVAVRLGLPPADVMAAAERLGARRLLRAGFEVGVSTHPEEVLRRQVDAVPDEVVRARLRGPLDRLVDQKARLHLARGADDVRAAGRALDETFSAITGRAATRRAGQTYAGRTLVYQEASRDTRLELGRPFVERLADPLHLLLHAADWLVAEVTDRYGRLLNDWVCAELRRTGRDTLPYGYVVGRLTPELTELDGVLPQTIRDIVEEFQRRWSRVLRLNVQERSVSYSSARLRGAVSREFDAHDRPRFATCHSPDLIIDAPSVEAIAAEDYRVIIGELHVGLNSLEARAFVDQYPAPDELIRLAEQSAQRPRIIAVPSKQSPFVTSRAAPPTASTSSDFSYAFLHEGAALLDPPGHAIAVGDLDVALEGDKVVVRSTSDGSVHDWCDLLADVLGAITVNTFQLLPQADHTPRIDIDGVVVARERWTVPAGELAWARETDESSLFWQVQRWRTERGIPEQVFVKSPHETKPFAVDFADLSSVGVLAAAVRALLDVDERISFTEQLPRRQAYWLVDAEGNEYTSELRVAAVAGGRTDA